MKLRLVLLITVTSLGLAGTVGPAFGSHAWSIYHWATQSHPITLITTDSMTSEWQFSLEESLDRWAQSSKFGFNLVPGSTDSKVRRRCNARDGQIIACNLSYGNTGWLGIAGINIDSDGHIVRGYTKMNDFYSGYWDQVQRNHVVCQELGHLLGLGHTSEDGSSQDTCMDYSNSTSSQWPNSHDYGMLNTIYDHLDSYDSWDGGGNGDNGTGSDGCNAPQGRGCNKFGFDLDNGPPMGVPVQVGLHHEIWVASDMRGGYWIHHILVAPGDRRLKDSHD